MGVAGIFGGSGLCLYVLHEAGAAGGTGSERLYEKTGF